MAHPTADDFNKMIDEGKFDELPDAFRVACQTWDARLVAGYGPVITRLYELGTEPALNALEKILLVQRVYRRGPWQGIKKVFKLAEAKQDARFYGLISRGVDINWAVGQIRLKTRNYMKRRTWRTLRTLPKKDPATYVKMALGLLEQYAEQDLNQYIRCRLWAYNHVGFHGSVGGSDRGNATMKYTQVRGRQRTQNSDNWPRDQWTPRNHEYPVAAAWKGHLAEIVDSLSRVKANETAKLLISIAQRECGDEMAAMSAQMVMTLFASTRDAVLDLALSIAQQMPPTAFPEDFILGLMSHTQPKVVEWALKFIEANYTFEKLGMARVLELVRHPNEAVAIWALKLLRSKADPKDIAWEQLRAWFNSPVPGIRAEAITLATDHWAVWSAPAKDIFDLFDVIHPDVHKAAFKWLIEKYEFKDLGRENIFDLFDSDWADVRDFAKQLVVKYFDEMEALADLGRLAEHPEPGIQHWVVELVHQHLRQDADRLVKLMPFFRQVVFHVNRGGPEKDAIFAMLIDLAAGSRARAEAVVKLCAEFVRAFGRIEHVKSLVGLARLRNQYADLDVPLVLLPLESAKRD
ncbi:MAG: hypothetical protein AB7K09_15400 [Planctomycetota bacterium]